VHAPSEEKSDDSKDSFYEQLEQVFHHIPKYHMNILLGDFNAKVGGEYFQTGNQE
jgi:endonuclease/exonuclease/phosphatase family metal-dependent hydrolase